MWKSDLYNTTIYGSNVISCNYCNHLSYIHTIYVHIYYKNMEDLPAQVHYYILEAFTKVYTIRRLL